MRNSRIPYTDYRRAYRHAHPCHANRPAASTSPLADYLGRLTAGGLFLALAAVLLIGLAGRTCPPDVSGGLAWWTLALAAYWAWLTGLALILR